MTQLDLESLRAEITAIGHLSHASPYRTLGESSDNLSAVNDHYRVIVKILDAALASPAPVVPDEDDPPCTDCGGTGTSHQTERRCACQPPAPVEAGGSVNILKDVTTEWDTEREPGSVTVHHRMIDGVLCRWWGERTPGGVAIINAAALSAILPATEGPKS